MFSKVSTAKSSSMAIKKLLGRNQIQRTAVLVLQESLTRDVISFECVHIQFYILLIQLFCLCWSDKIMLPVFRLFCSIALLLLYHYIMMMIWQQTALQQLFHKVTDIAQSGYILELWVTMFGLLAFILFVYYYILFILFESIALASALLRALPCESIRGQGAYILQE